LQLEGAEESLKRLKGLPEQEGSVVGQQYVSMMETSLKDKEREVVKLRAAERAKVGSV